MVLISVVIPLYNSEKYISNENRIEAVIDIKYVAERARRNDNIMALARDNLFDFYLIALYIHVRKVSIDKEVSR